MVLRRIGNKSKHNLTNAYIIGHCDVMTRTRYPHYWPFVPGMRRLPVDSQHKGAVIQTFDSFFVVMLDKKVESVILWGVSTPMGRHSDAHSRSYFANFAPGTHLTNTV